MYMRARDTHVSRHTDFDSSLNLNKYKYFPIKFIHYKPASGKNAFYKFKGLKSSFQETSSAFDLEKKC